MTAANGQSDPPATTAIVESPTRALASSWASMRTMSEAIAVAELVAKSNSFPKIKNAGQALVLMLAGSELGFGPFASLVGVHMIQGVPTVGAHLKAAAIKQSGKYDFDILTPKGQERKRCDLKFYRIDRGIRTPIVGGEISEVLAEVHSSLTKKDNWIAHPDDMLFATALNKGYRRCCPDLTGGVLTYDEGELLDAPEHYLPAPTPARRSEPIDAEHEPASVTQYASEHQVARIGELIEQKHVAEKAWKESFQRRGATCARELTADQAAEVIRSLEARPMPRAAAAPAESPEKVLQPAGEG